MSTPRKFRGWVALTIALLLWTLTLYAFWSIEQQKKAHVIFVSGAQEEIRLIAQSSRLRGLLNDTKNDRTTLQGIISADVIALVDAIDAVGKTVNLNVQVSNVQPEAQKKGALPGTAIPVTLVVQSEGTFPEITRLVELLNALSIPTTIQQVELVRSGSLWRLTARLKVLTASVTS
jgi:hypothetical protein